MFREILRTRKFIIGFCVLLIGFSVLFLRSGKLSPVFPRRESPGIRQVEYVPSPPVKSTVSTEMSDLKSKIEAKIEMVISLIDEVLD